MKSLIIIEKNTILARLILFFFDKKKTSIYYLHPYQIDNYVKFSKRIKSFKEFKLDHSIEQEITFEANQETLKIQNNSNFRIIKNFFDKLKIPQEVLIAFKKYQLKNISYQIRFGLLKKYFEDNYSKDYKIYFLLNNKFGFNYSKKYIKNKVTKFRNLSLINIFRKLFCLLIIIFYLPFYIILHILRHGFDFIEKKPKEYKFGLHFNNHIFNRNKYANKNKYLNSRNDYHLTKILSYDDRNTIYIYSSWNFDKENNLRSIQEIKSRGSDIGFEFDHPINLKILKISIKYYLKSLIFLFFNFYKEKIFFLDIVTIYQVIRDLIKCEIFCTKYKIKNFISRDEYDPIHICRTLVFKKYKLKNNGIAHSICLEHFTNVCGPYTYFETYYTQGNFYYENIYKNYWFSNFHKSLGPIYGKYVKNAISNVKEKKKFTKTYGLNKKVCYMIGSFDSDTCPFDNEIELKFSEKLLEILRIDKNLLLFVVGRKKNQAKKFLNKLKNYEKYKKRIIIDNYYSTYDLLGYCDYVICGSTSSILFEATRNPNISIIPANYRKILKNPLSKYKKIKIFENMDQIIEFFKNDLSSKKKMKLNNQQLKKIL